MRFFWSWQSDHDLKTAKYFVRDALKQAAKDLNKELELDEADRIEIDHDTQGVPGTPEVWPTILDKIDGATAFIADVSPVGVSEAGKLLQNPNVMVELGYARRALSTTRIILVANSVYLPRPEDLPFDLRGGRAPVTYRLESDADKATRSIVFKGLVAALKPRITDIFKEEKNRIERAAKLSLQGQVDDRTIWFEPTVPVRVQNSSKQWASVKPFPGAHAYMRITPSKWPTGVRLAQMTPDGGSQVMINGMASAGDWGNTEAGTLHYWWRQDSAPTVSPAMAHWFQESGILWGVWSDIIDSSDQRWFSGVYMLQFWAKFLRTAIAEYRKLGGEGPFRVDAGLVGIEGARWYANIDEGRLVSAADTMRFTSVDITEDADSQDRYLTELMNRMTDRFGIASPMSLPQVVDLSYR